MAQNGSHFGPLLTVFAPFCIFFYNRQLNIFGLAKPSIIFGVKFLECAVPIMNTAVEIHGGSKFYLRQVQVANLSPKHSRSDNGRNRLKKIAQKWHSNDRKTLFFLCSEEGMRGMSFGRLKSGHTLGRPSFGGYWFWGYLGAFWVSMAIFGHIWAIFALSPFFVHVI